MTGTTPTNLFPLLARGLARLRPRLPARPAAELVVLAVLPWLLLAVDPLWVYGSLYRDTWGYFGAYQNLPEYLRVYGDYYTAGRLSALIPGWLAYRWLPPVAANHVLHLGLFYAATLSAYVVLSRTAGRRAGLLAAVALGGHHFFLRAVGWDYVDGFVLTYFLFAAALLTQAARSDRWRWWATAAGAAAGAMTVANFGFVILTAPLAALFVAVNRGERRHPADAVGFWAGAGAVGLVAALGLASRKLGGGFLFLLPTFNFMKAFDAETAAQYIHPVGDWAGRAAWLVIPAGAAAGAVVMLVLAAVRRVRGERTGLVPVYLQIQFLALLAFLAAGQARGKLGHLEVWLAASATVMVPAFLAAGGQWGRWTEALSPARFRVLAVVWTAAVVLSAAAPERVPFAAVWGGIPLAVALGCSVGAFLLPLLLPARLAVGVAVAVLFGTANAVVRDQFRMSDSVSGSAAALRLGRAQELDPERKAAFLAIAEAARWARTLDETGKVWYWYDIDDPLGPVYDMIAHANFHHLKVINTAFPRLDSTVLCGWQLAQVGRATVVVLSPDPGAGEVAAAALRARGMAAAVGERRLIGGRRAVAVRATVVTVAPAP